MGDVQKEDIHYRVTNWEDDCDQQRIEQHVYQLPLLVPHILLELRVLSQLNHRLHQLCQVSMEMNDFVNKSNDHHYHQQVHSEIFKLFLNTNRSCPTRVRSVTRRRKSVSLESSSLVEI